MSYVWPIALIVLSNIVYQICAKSTPSSMSPLASLSVTYFVGMISSIVLYYLLEKSPNIIKEYSHLNWSPLVLGLVIVGLEVGFIYSYRAGWSVSTASIVQSSILTIALIAVGFFLYHEVITWNKIVGIIICLIGLIFINK